MRRSRTPPPPPPAPKEEPKADEPKKLFGWIPPADRSKKMWQCHDESLALALAPPDCEEEPATSYTSAPADPQGVVTDLLACIVGKMFAGVPFFTALVSCLQGPGPMPPPGPTPPPEPTTAQTLWWPFTYGQSRLRLGEEDEGEGSTGATWAAAIREDGIFGIDETEEEEEFHLQQGWMQCSERLEKKWSAGRWSLDKYGDLARHHPVTGVFTVRNSAEALDHLKNGRCLTLASNFGTRTIRKVGNPPIMLATWDDNWPHQMSCSDGWNHPDQGPVLDIDNNWGPGAHPPPVSGEDPGGFWMAGKDFDKVCRTGEVYAYSGFQGFRSTDVFTAALQAMCPDMPGAGERYNLKAIAKKALGDLYHRIWQVTGSCVGAGGGTMLQHLMGAELAALGGGRGGKQPERPEKLPAPLTPGDRERAGSPDSA